MVIDESYVRTNLRQVQEAKAIFSHENVFMLDEAGALVGLNLSSSQVNDLSDFSKFKHLRYLDLSDNLIADPSPLKLLSRLEKVDLSFNRIDDLSFVLQLPRLTFLNISSNSVSRLPSSFSKLGVPIKWHYIFQDRGVFLEGNPLVQPPFEVLLRDQTDVKAYLRSMDDGSLPLREFKAIVLGGGRAGKTSLVRRLSEEPFRVDEEVTAGVNLRARQSPNGEIKGHFWDFGGQELMYATHTCFLTRRAVYLVVLDGRREEKAEYWLKLIESFSPDSPVFILINKIDENQFYDLNRGELRRKHKNIEGIFPISCKTGEGLGSFFDRFWHRAGEFELPKIQFSSQWTKVKDKLLSHEEPFVVHVWYLRVCADSGVSEPDEQVALLNCLHDLGMILHFSSFGLSAYIVLQPAWLTTAIYLLINDSKSKLQHGVLAWKDVDSILARAPEPWTYSPEARRFLIDVAKSFEVCFEVDHEHLLLPDLLPRNEPDDLPVFEKTKSQLILTFAFLPIAVFHRCLIQLHSDLVEKCLWLTGIFLQESSLNARAIIRLDEGESRITIEVDGKRRRDYLTFLRKVVRDTVRRSGELTYAECIRLPTEIEYLVQYEELVKLKTMGVTSFPHGLSGRVFEIDSLIAQVEAVEGFDPKEDNLPNNIRPLPEQAFCFVVYASEDRPFVDRLAEKLEFVGIEVFYDAKIRAGEHYTPLIEKKILDAAVIIVVVSPESHSSSFVRRELALALQNEKPIVPIQLRFVDKWLDISLPQWIPASDEGRMIKELYKSLSAYLP